MTDGMENEALWLDGLGQEPRVGPAQIPEPGEGEICLKNKAVAVQPGEWKIQAGIIPIPLQYPTIIGLCFSGIVEKVGPGVTRFKAGDRVATNSSGVLRDDHRFGAYQRFSLTPQSLTAKIGDYSFEEAASLATMYGPASALFLHLGLERPTNPPKNPEKKERVLVWGASSSFGGLAAQLASKSGYIVVGVASARNEELAKSLGVSLFVDRASETVTEDLISLGPFKAILAASESGEDQVKIGSILTAHGGGHFVTTMGVRREVNLPKGVTASFHQFLDDFLDPANSEFTEWFWWNYLEDSFVQNQLKSLPVEVYGGLSSTKRAWDVLREGKISGKRMIIRPDVDQ